MGKISDPWTSSQLKSSLKDEWITITGHTASWLVVNGADDRPTEISCWAPTDDEEVIASCLWRKKAAAPSV